MRFLILIILFLYINPNTEAAIKFPSWHCGIESKLKGTAENIYDYGQDTFIGKDKFSCVNYKNSLTMNSDHEYEIRMIGELKTGFIPSDEIEVRITQFRKSIPPNFTQKYNQLIIYSDFPVGEYISIYLLAIPEDKEQERIFITINSPVRLANDVKAFLQNAELIIEKIEMKIALK